MAASARCQRTAHHATRMTAMTRIAVLAALLVSLGAGAASAFEQPPITGPQDKACRDEATAKVFDAPDPDNLGLHAVGKTIYFACMDRFAEAEKAKDKPVKTAKRSRQSV